MTRTPQIDVNRRTDDVPLARQCRAGHYLPSCTGAEAFISRYFRRGVPLHSLVPRRLRAIFCRFGWSAGAFVCRVGGRDSRRNGKRHYIPLPGRAFGEIWPPKENRGVEHGKFVVTADRSVVFEGLRIPLSFGIPIFFRAKSMHTYAELMLSGLSMIAAAAGFGTILLQ